MRIPDLIIGTLIVGLFVVVFSTYYITIGSDYGAVSNFSTEINTLNAMNQTADLAISIGNQTTVGRVTSVDFFVSAVKEVGIAVRLAFSSVSTIQTMAGFVIEKLGISPVFYTVFLAVILVGVTFAIINFFGRSNV